MTLFKDKTVIITGAASGIGRALGAALARRGASVILSDRQAEPLAGAVDILVKSGFRAEAATLDVSDREAVAALVNETADRYGRLDYLFNNAGIAIGGEVRDISIDDWRSVLDVNLYGVVHGIDAAYPLMVRQGSGHIINTASIAGLALFPNSAPYVASKYGVVGLSNALRIEGADLGVRVSVVCPGYIKTGIFHRSKYVKMNREKILESLPEKFGITPDACADAILKGVERNRAIIVVTGFAKFLWLLYRISPGLMIWMMEREIKKSRREMRIGD